MGYGSKQLAPLFARHVISCDMVYIWRKYAPPTFGGLLSHVMLAAGSRAAASETGLLAVAQRQVAGEVCCHAARIGAATAATADAAGLAEWRHGGVLLRAAGGAGSGDAAAQQRLLLLQDSNQITSQPTQLGLTTWWPGRGTTVKAADFASHGTGFKAAAAQRQRVF